MINIGIIGYGYWGPNLVRNFLGSSSCKLVAVADRRMDRLKVVHTTYPSIRCLEDANEIHKDTSINAVVIATPVHTHFSLAKSALLAGKHVLIEKPMTSSVVEGVELLNLAADKGLILMVDHTFLYTGAVQKIKELIEGDKIGKLQYFDSTRINLGLFQSDINVLWDLAPHDISILQYLHNEKPVSVNATGICHTNNGIENIAYLTLNFASDFIAHINCSWTSPVKVRQTLIGGNSRMVVYNDLEPSDKIKIYDTGFKHETDAERNSILVDYRVGDIYIPKIATHEALKGVVNDFLDAINTKKTPVSNSELGLDVVKILAAAQQSIKNSGKQILI